MSKNPVMFWLIILFASVNIIDVITAYFILPGESNPLYLLLGSMNAIILLKIGLIVFIAYMYRRNVYPTNFTYYQLLTILVIGSVLVGIGCYSNILGILNPEIVVMGESASTGEKMTAYGWFVGLFFIIPSFFSLLIFWLYDKSYKHVRIDKEYYNNKRWWQL